MAQQAQSSFGSSTGWFTRSVAVAAALGSSTVWAQSASMTAAPAVSFAIRGFSIKGDNPLSQSETSRVLAPFLRADASMDVLQKASNALEAALRDAGFGLHRVSLPPQSVSDTVVLNIVKFTIGKVAVEGNSIYSIANIRSSVPELSEGGAPNFNRLAAQTSIANENPGKQISVSLRESTQADKIDATVLVKETKPWNFSMALANSGSASSGNDRTTFSGGYNNLFGTDHQLTTAYTTSLERTGDVKQLGLSYRMPLYRASSVLSLNYTESDVVGNFDTFTSTGQGRTVGLNTIFHFSPAGGRRSYLTLGLDDKLFKAAIVNGTAISVDRRVRPLSMGYTMRLESDAFIWSYNLGGSINTSTASPANSLAAFQAEDSRITNPIFRVYQAGASFSTAFGGNWLFNVRGQLQSSNQALIAGEQFGLGGLATVRGVSDRVITGDKGIATSMELTTPEIAPGLRSSAFIDAGWLENNRTDGTTKLAQDKLASVGLGLRFANPNGLNLSADYGRIITGSALPLSINSSAPQKGHDKLHLNVSVRF